MSCLSSIFHSPGSLRPYQLGLTERNIIYSCPSENTAEWLGEAASVNGTAGSLRDCIQGLALGLLFLIIEIICIQWSLKRFCVEIGGLLSVFSCSYLLPSRELPVWLVKVLEIIAWSGYSRLSLSCGTETTGFIGAINPYIFKVCVWNLYVFLI